MSWNGNNQSTSIKTNMSSRNTNAVKPDAKQRKSVETARILEPSEWQSFLPPIHQYSHNLDESPKMRQKREEKEVPVV